MNPREEGRLQVLNGVLAGRLGVREASRLLGVSERHGWRMLAAYRREGAAAVAHGNRGRQPAHTKAPEVRSQVLELAQGTYAGLNDSHLAELLAEREGVRVARSTLRRWLREAGRASPRRRRSPKHRQRRERYPQEGMLLQVDGSQHDWLEGRGPRLTLLAAIDDATGSVVAALFREQEDTQGYLLLLREIVERQGMPGALYSDRHSIFVRSARERESLEEQLRGEREPTQMGRALRTLGISLVLAHSPQAKGRIERLWQTLQDRLVAELRLAGATNSAEADQVLQVFLPRFDRRFRVPPAVPGPAYRSAEGVDLDAVICFRYYRTVASDNTVAWRGQPLQLLPNPQRASYARARVEVQERLDGRVVVVYQGAVIGARQAPPGPVTLRALKNRGKPAPQSLDDGPASGRETRNGGRVIHEQARSPAGRKAPPWKPGPGHPWKRGLLT